MNRHTRRFLLFSLPVFFSVLSLQAQYPEDYRGKPYRPCPGYEGVQHIPGRIELAWYDLGGEGIAYHDKDSTNNSVLLSHERGVPPGSTGSSRCMVTMTTVQAF
jgi:hypothetical protein